VTLLAVDLGLRSGFALYGKDGRLRAYRSTNFGSRKRLRAAVPGILSREAPALTALALEGPQPLAAPWESVAGKRGVRVLRLGAEAWRERLLLPREQRTGQQAKRTAGELALQVIQRSGALRPTGPMRHDAAEAIMIGLWGVVELGWVSEEDAKLR